MYLAFDSSVFGPYRVEGRLPQISEGLDTITSMLSVRCAMLC